MNDGKPLVTMRENRDRRRRTRSRSKRRITRSRTRSRPQRIEMDEGLLNAFLLWYAYAHFDASSANAINTGIDPAIDHLYQSVFFTQSINSACLLLMRAQAAV